MLFMKLHLSKIGINNLKYILKAQFHQTDILLLLHCIDFIDYKSLDQSE